MRSEANLRIAIKRYIELAVQFSSQCNSLQKYFIISQILLTVNDGTVFSKFLAAFSSLHHATDDHLLTS